MVETSGERIFFELSRETLERTIAGDYAEGTTVNMERSLSLSDRLGGHFVTGHIDGVGRVEAISKEGEFCEMDFRVDLVSPGLVAEKGSVAVNGVSLTVARWNRIGSGGVFRVALIPETLDRTNLGTAPVGTRVNIEYDLIARYVVEALTARSEEERGQ
ncbi:MAG: riboflavin synthase [Candidatus Hydrogenedentota bacterium]|nr:MAG: riboflavin synthase [Candidatus Hydrogenedentota bacterium]